MPPKPHRLVADVDPSFVQKVLHVAKREREPNVHHYRQANDLGRGLEVTERAGFEHLGRLSGRPSLLKIICSDRARPRHHLPACRGGGHRPHGQGHPNCDPPPSSATVMCETAIPTKTNQKRQDRYVWRTEKRHRWARVIGGRSDLPAFGRPGASQGRKGRKTIDRQAKSGELSRPRHSTWGMSDEVIRGRDARSSERFSLNRQFVVDPETVIPTYACAFHP